MLTDQQIYDNRRKVIAYLQNPNRRKAKGTLQDSQTSRNRCCLGHMCHAVGIRPEYDVRRGPVFGDRHEAEMAPRELIDALGLNDESGVIDIYSETSFITDSKTSAVIDLFRECGSLTKLNDETNTSPQMIGKMLEVMILGGDGTPWRKLNI